MNALGADLIPDPTTAGDFCRRFSEADVLKLMEAINAVRPQLWRGRGRELLGPIAYIDVDGTLAPTSGKKKQGMDISYKGVWGYHPLIVSLANTSEVLYIVNRPGNTDFSLTAHFERWAKRVDFIFGMDANVALASRAEALGEESWQHIQREPKHEPLTDQTRQRQPDEKSRVVRKRGYVNLELKYEDVGMEFRRFIHSVILIPCRVTRCARGITIRILGYNPPWTVSSAPGAPSSAPASDSTPQPPMARTAYTL